MESMQDYIDSFEDKENSTTENSQTTNSSDQVILKVDSLILLEDSTLEQIPKYAMKILNQIPDMKRNGGQATQDDLFATLIYCIAIETGFFSTEILQTNQFCLYPTFSYNIFNLRNILQLSKLPIDFLMNENENFYKIKLELINFPDKKYLLICMKTGDSFCITLTPKNHQTTIGKSIYLSISRYVLSMRKTKNYEKIFRNLNELSILLKNQLFIPIRNYLMENEMHPSLIGLPNEIILIILKFLKLNDIQALSKTCWQMRSHCLGFYQDKF